MPEDIRICPLCGGQHSRFFDRCEFRGQTVVNRLCLDCGLVYQSPRMAEAESAVFYAEEYRLLNEDSANPTARNIAAQHARAEVLVTFARPTVQKVTRALDIGCSMGILLRHFEEAYHCQLAGIEPGEAHRSQARKEGLTVYAGLEELEEVEKGRFDLVSMAHVLEHLPDPFGYLVHLRETLLDPAGWLLLEVPNLYAHDSFETAHLVSYSAHTLAQTLEKAGFDILCLEKHGRPRSALLPLYLTLLARHGSGTQRTFRLQPEQGVAFKRRTGMFRRRILERLFPKRAWIA